MRRLVKDLIVTAFAVGTSVLTAWILAAIDNSVHFALYAFSWWFIPIGAAICGAASASGYHLGFRVLPHRPTVLLMVNAVVLSLATYVLIFYIDYSMARARGVPVSTLVPFGQYLSLVIENRQQYIGLSNLGKLGPLNYLFVTVQMAGFAAGAFLAVKSLYMIPVCDHCDRVLRNPLVTVRASNSLLGLEDLFRQVRTALSEGRSAEAVSLLGTPNPAGANAVHKLALTLWTCDRCPVQFYSMFIKPGGEHVGQARDYSPTRDRAVRTAVAGA